MNKPQKIKKDPKVNDRKQYYQNFDQMSQAGKTPEEILPFLLSGEPDDPPFDLSDIK